MNKSRNSLYVLGVSQFLGMVGMTAFMPFIPLYVQELGIKDIKGALSWGGIIFGIGFISSALFSPIWGYLGDRYGRKLMVLRALGGTALSMILIAFAQNVYELLIFRIIQGFLTGIIASVSGFIGASTTNKNAGFSFGILQTSMFAGIIIGPVLGGFSIEHFGFRTSILAISVLLLILSFIIVLVFLDESKAKATDRISIKNNFSFVIKSARLRNIISVQFAVQVGIMALQPVIVLFAISITGNVPYATTLAGASFGVTAFSVMLASPIWGRFADKHGKNKTLVICLLASALLFLPQAFAKNIIFFLLIRVIFGIFVAGISPLTQAVMVENTPLMQRSGVIGIWFSGTFIGNALGPTIGGFIGSAISMRFVFLFSMILFITAFLLLTQMKITRKPN